jgi:hypothetical protein
LIRRGNYGSVAARALDALRVGDLDLVRVLLESLMAKQEQRMHACDLCQMRFRFPGELDDHMRVLHPEDWLRGLE